MPNQNNEEYSNGVTFLSFQSGTEGEPTSATMQALADFVERMHEIHIRVYTNIQVGKPNTPPPGGG